MNWWENLSEIVRALLIMTATGSIVAIFMFLLKPAIKTHLPKSVQYYLWVFVIISFLVPFSSLVSLPFATPLSQFQEVVDNHVKTTFERREELSQERYGIEYEALEAEEQIEVYFREIGLLNGKFNDYILLVLISMGAVSLLIDIAQYALYTLKLGRKRINIKENELVLLKSLCNAGRCPRLYRNTLASTPMLIGVFRPIIYLPDREYSDIQLKNILLHELTHLRRHDVAIKWIATITAYVHWFNPIVYFVRREIDRACELACDEAVIYKLDTDGKQSYGDTLIEMAADMKKSRVIVSTTMCEEKKTLKDRLSAIMHSKKHTKLVIVLSCVLLISTLCFIVVLGSSARHSNSFDETQASLLSVMHENAVPEGLTLKITSAARDDAEFLLTNGTESVVEYGYANRVERYVDGAWEAAVSETKEIFPENPEPLQAGQRMYGMTAWVRDNTELTSGAYRYLFLVNVRTGDLPAYPVVLAAPFEITE